MPPRRFLHEISRELVAPRSPMHPRFIQQFRECLSSAFGLSSAGHCLEICRRLATRLIFSITIKQREDMKDACPHPPARRRRLLRVFARSLFTVKETRAAASPARDLCAFCQCAWAARAYRSASRGGCIPAIFLGRCRRTKAAACAGRAPAGRSISARSFFPLAGSLSL